MPKKGEQNWKLSSSLLHALTLDRLDFGWSRGMSYSNDFVDADQIQRTKRKASGQAT